jgi:uncharacterized phiE125 gp8 family phage protein
MSLTLSTAPTLNVVTMEEIYDHIRVDVTGSPGEPVDASYITTLRDAAEAYLDGCGGIMGRALLTQTWALKLDYFPQRIWLPLPPLQSVSSITYLDTDGASQTLATSVYQVVNNGDQPSYIREAYSQFWPTTYDQAQAVTVTFVAGWTSADLVPRPIYHAIKLLVSDWYDHRGSGSEKSFEELPFAVRALLSPWRIQPL